MPESNPIKLKAILKAEQGVTRSSIGDQFLIMCHQIWYLQEENFLPQEMQAWLKKRIKKMQSGSNRVSESQAPLERLIVYTSLPKIHSKLDRLNPPQNGSHVIQFI